MEKYVVTTTITEITELYADNEKHALDTYKDVYTTRNRTTEINIVNRVEE